MNNLINLLKKVQLLEIELNQLKTQIQDMLRADGVIDVTGEIERLLKRAGKDGMTVRDLRKYSRALSHIDKATITAALNGMLDGGQVVLKEQPSSSGRGRRRTAYHWVGV